MNDENHAPKRSNNILIAVLALIALLLLIAFLKPEPKSEKQNDDAGSPSPLPIVSITNIPLEDWSGLERAEKNIQSLGKNQVILPDIVQDPTNERIVYFATIAYEQKDGEPSGAIVGIYQYNNEDFTFERLYKETLTFDDFGINSVLSYRVAGVSEGSLIIAKRHPNPIEPPDACPGLLSTYPVQDDYFLMNLSDPYAGFTPFAPPQVVAQEADKLFEACLERIGASFPKQ